MVFNIFFIFTILNCTCHPMITFVMFLFHYCFMLSSLILTFTSFHMNIFLSNCLKLVLTSTFFYNKTMFTLLVMSILVMIPLILMIFFTPMIVTVMTISFTLHFNFRFLFQLILEFMPLNFFDKITQHALFTTLTIIIVLNNYMLLRLHSIFTYLTNFLTYLVV